MKFKLPGKVPAFILILSLPAFAGSENYVSVDASKTHVDFDLSKGIADLKLYSSDSFKGPPKIELTERGLVVTGKLVCSWPHGAFNPKESFNMVLKSETSKGPPKDAPCREGGPIVSTWGDGGNGTAVLYFEVERIAGDIAEINDKSSKLFLDLRPLKGKFSIRKPGEISNEPGD